VFAAGNEDERSESAYSKHFVRFVPGSKEKGALGYVAFGYTRNPFNDESAMNEAGLFYDFTALEKLDTPREGKPRGKFNTINEMLTKCSTVSEAVKFLAGFDLPNMSSAQILIGDATGASAIVERHAVTHRPAGVDFQVATNFRTSAVPKAAISCERFKLSDTQLGLKKRMDAESAAAILGRVKAAPPSESMTWYSLVCDLKRRQVHLYRTGEFDKPFKFSLTEDFMKSKGMDHNGFTQKLREN
jgi:hypothetical protein